MSSELLSQVLKPSYRDFRPGDVRHSLADLSKSRELLDYKPQYRITEGIKKAMPGYISSASENHV